MESIAVAMWPILQAALSRKNPYFPHKIPVSLSLNILTNLYLVGNYLHMLCFIIENFLGHLAELEKYKYLLLRGIYIRRFSFISTDASH